MLGQAASNQASVIGEIGENWSLIFLNWAFESGAPRPHVFRSRHGRDELSLCEQK